ncbi:MAG: hypothetical protein JJU29_13215 [Verrucomicrobia bacterium]|nr:hypothetical protein [Verrucomicrobiota bacterium]MCH8514457.1 hypothetical protein [Kiritimatiellia bacterium]
MIANESVAMPEDPIGRRATRSAGGPFGVAHGRWVLTYELPRSEWNPFKNHFEDGIRQIILNAGANVRGGAGRGSSFDGSKSFEYLIKGEEGEMDIMGSLDILYVNRGEGKVQVLVHAFEVEMDVEARIKRAPPPPNEPDFHETFMAMWEAHPTAREVRAQQNQRKEKALDFHPDDRPILLDSKKP